MNFKKSATKAIILIIGSVILSAGYIGTLLFVVKTGIESPYINLIATIIFLFLYFGLFISVKKWRKGYLQENKNNVINILYLAIPFIAGIIAYLLSKNVFIMLITFIVAQVMYTIYYKNFFPVPGYNRAYKLYRNQDFKNAEAVLVEILKKYPENYETLLLLGLIHKNNLKYEEAIKCFEKASTIRPYNVQPLINQINCYISIENFDKAIDISEKSIEIEPENWNIYYSIGLSYYLKDDFTKASEYFQKTTKYNIHPLQLFLVHYGLAASLSKINKQDEASSEFEKCKRYAYKYSLNYWEKQLLLIENNMNKASTFVKEAVDYVKAEKKQIQN